MDLAALQKKLQKNILGKALLLPLSVGYGAAVALRGQTYKYGFLKPKSVNSKVICVGNLTTGGTGKTTAVMFLARIFALKNIKTAVISRGYKRKTRKKDVIIIDKNTPGWRSAGDEPYMMYKALGKYKIPVVVSADRYLACQTAVKNFKSEVLLLDDGFGHIKLKRDLDILLIDARSGFVKNKLLPLGTLREPKSALKRAGLVLLTHCDTTENGTIKKIIEEIAEYNLQIEIIKTRHKPTHFFDVCKSEIVNLKNLQGKAAVLSAIGNPPAFEDTLVSLNIKPEQVWRYPDHHAFTTEELKTIYKLKGGLPLITTYKDFVRFPVGWQEILKENVYFLSIHLDIIGGHKKLTLLKEKLGI